MTLARPPIRSGWRVVIIAIGISATEHAILLSLTQRLPDPKAPVQVTEIELATPEPTNATEKKIVNPPTKQQEKAQSIVVAPPTKVTEPIQPIPPPKKKPLMKTVELDQPESKVPPKNARFLSDKDREVERETRARKTELEARAAQEAQESATEPSVAGRVEQRVVSPLLRMRGQRPVPSSMPADNPHEGIGQTRPEQQFNLNLDHQAFDRILGSQALSQREAAKDSRVDQAERIGGKNPNNYLARWKQVAAALENFIPEVAPGNQTALGTRADPFAVYLTHMHRAIHTRWGFGFLEDLGRKSDSHPLNKMSLGVVLEIVVGNDGSVKKVTIVKPSGQMPFDVAAIQSVYASAPFPAPPRRIHSYDGNVYLHWGFYRDERQCGTFNASPFILTHKSKPRT